MRNQYCNWGKYMKYRTLKNFFQSSKGNFAVMTALLSVPVLAGAIMMVEYSNLSDNHARLQNAVDAAALYAGKHAMETGNLPNAGDVKAFLAENFDGHIGSVSIAGDGSDDTNYSVEATSIAPRHFLGSVPIAAYTQKAKAFVPKTDLSNVAVALVLDNTTSMDHDEKIETLRREATEFIDEIEKSANDPSTVRVALVPFHRLVNVGTTHRNAPWLNLESEDVDDWEGCVGLRRFDYTYEHEYKFVGGVNAKFKALLDTECTEPITPLTNDWDLLRDNISELDTVYGTFVAVGVMWGLSVLSPSVPFTEVTALDDPTRVMIVMADGDNSKSLSKDKEDQDNDGSGTKGDEQSEDACDSAKAEGVTIYSIAFGKSISDDGKALLQYCASDITNYFVAADSDGLKDAFKKIGRKITRFRLTG
ncbi:MAG: pilus assembly protein [Pseudomonadota bacterium]